MKRGKRSSKRRRQITFILLVIVLVIFAAGPFAVHLERMRQAKSEYDVQKVQEELKWVENYGGPLNRLEFLSETKLWLELYLGVKDAELKLTAYQDEKHQFMLANVYLQTGNLTKAQNLLESMSPSPRRELGKGLLTLTKGDAQQTRELLEDSRAAWKSMTRQEQCLRYLTLAQAAITLEDYFSTKTELEVAQQLDPKNPAIISVEFNLAIAQGQWARAKELSQAIDDQTWRPTNSQYQKKRAVLAIHDNDLQVLGESLALLKEFPLGDASINYLKGINALKQGQIQEGKKLLDLALKSGLEGQARADAQKALEQISDRQKADRFIRSW